MRATRDSGVDWLGEIPADWEVRPCWSSFRRVKQTGFPEEELLSVYRDHGVVPKSSRDDNHNVESEDLTSYQLVRVGDMVMNKMKAWQGSIALSDHRGIVSPAYFVYRPTQEFSRKYFHYLLRSAQYVAHYNRISKGVRVGQWDLDPTYFRTTSLIVPPLDEQRRIADFLDRETAKIDALIAKQEQLITTLDERLNALLRLLATRGNREDVELKSASSTWLSGELIPSHWMELPISRLLDLRSGTGITSESIDDDGEYPVFGGGGVRGFTDTFTNEGDFVLIGRQGGAGLITRVSGRFFASEHAIVCYPLVTLDLDWSAAVLEVMDLGQYSQSSAQPGISVDRIRRVRLPAPPLAEQKEIGQIIREEGASIRFLSSKAAKCIELLSERRQALISAAVTGKLEVGV